MYTFHLRTHMYINTHTCVKNKTSLGLNFIKYKQEVDSCTGRLFTGPAGWCPTTPPARGFLQYSFLVWRPLSQDEPGNPF